MEVAVDASETDVGDRVETPKLVEDVLAEACGGDLLLTGVDEPTIISTDHSMTVELPNGDTLDLDFAEEPPILEKRLG